jgi:peptidoglycan/LPS O-acetylase OafA/YrhL
MLDGWRALAAITVVCHHLGFGSRQNAGHVGVMVFFVISGYCIAATSDSCLRKGYGFKTYMQRRLRRIYPPYFFAVCFFVITRLLKWKMEGVLQLPSTITAWIQTLTLTQWFSLIGHPASYAAENKSLVVAAFWSLNYEEQFYLVIGVLMLLSLRFGRPILWGILALLVPAIGWNVANPSTSYGFFLEYWVHFSLGTLVFYRLCILESRTARRAIDLGISSLVLVSGIVWAMHKGAGFAAERSVYAEWLITGVFALMLIGARSIDGLIARTRFGAGLMKLGTLTYSLYLVHQFNLQLVERVAQPVLRLGIPHFVAIPIEIAEMLLIASVFWYVCERPFINKPLSRSRSGISMTEPAPVLISNS